MRKFTAFRSIQRAMPLAFFCIFSACDNEGTHTHENTVAQKNLETVRVINKAFDTGDTSQIDSVVSADFIDHTDRGEKDRDSLKLMISMVRKTFPDMKGEVIRELADSNYVFTWMRFTGTSGGQMDMPKGPFDMKAVQITRLKDGKIVEHWEAMDMQDMMKMMPPMNLPDTSKH
jgi:predicted SnoaL-like aldol condensation-catalyzing enzyme